MTIDAAYTRWAGRYDADRNLTRDLDRSVTRELLGGRRFGLIVEAGCGTGKNTSFLAGLGHSVLAMDFSAGMLERAGESVREPNVQFQQVDIQFRWPCADGSAGLVSCNLVLEHLETMDHVFLEAARCLAPGGLFFISELHPFRQYRGGQAHFIDEDGATVAIQAYRHHISDFLRLAAEAGFRLDRLDEWWHAEDSEEPPRLLSLLLRREAPRIESA